MSEGKLESEVAIVTGAGRNIGRAIAERFADEGARVAAADIDEENLDSVVSSITGSGGTAISVETDVTDESDVENLIEVTEREFGPVDILVNNAAVKERADLLEMTVETWERTLAVNNTGMFLCSREAAGSMIENGGGRIVNVGSISGQKPEPTSVAYGTSKAGVFNFTRSIAHALGEHDIRVNTLNPGRTGAPTMPFNIADGEEMEDFKETVEGEDEEIATRTPLGRLCTPEEQAEGALFLVSDESSYMTGDVLNMTGGRS